MKHLNTNIARLRTVGLLEGLSCIGLFLIAMPLKYIRGYENATQAIGMAHGVLFILYNILILPAMVEHKWSFIQVNILFFSSILPFGTFISDAKFLKKYA